jgi:tRNA (adenine37-N6)-methyltransferase
MPITFNPIAIIYTPFKAREGMPVQAKGAKGIRDQVKLDDAYVTGLDNLDGFSQIILILHFHKSVGFELLITPFLDNRKRGVFASRAPEKPNSTGISVVRLLSIGSNIIHFKNVDMLAETPLLDIKPCIPDFDVHEAEKMGWMKIKPII